MTHLLCRLVYAQMFQTSKHGQAGANCESRNLMSFWFGLCSCSLIFALFSISFDDSHMHTLVPFARSIFLWLISNSFLFVLYKFVIALTIGWFLIVSRLSMFEHVQTTLKHGQTQGNLKDHCFRCDWAELCWSGSRFILVCTKVDTLISECTTTRHLRRPSKDLRMMKVIHTFSIQF